MGTIVVKDLPDDVYATLQRLAAERRQPFDAFVRDTLREIVTPYLGGASQSQAATKPRRRTAKK